jgi:hypothetical protein
MRPRQSCGRLRRRPWNSAIQRKAAEQFIEFRLIYHAPPGAVRANSAMKALQDEMADDFLRSCYETAVVALCAQVAAMRGDGASPETIARAVHIERRRDPRVRGKSWNDIIDSAIRPGSRSSFDGSIDGALRIVGKQLHPPHFDYRR